MTPILSILNQEENDNHEMIVNRLRFPLLFCINFSYNRDYEKFRKGINFEFVEVLRC